MAKKCFFLFNKNMDSISFGQKIPTLEFLKSASGIQVYPEANRLCTSIESRFPGHHGYQGRAEILAKEIELKNPVLAPILEKLRNLQDKSQKEAFIQDFISNNGNLIDVVI